MLANHPPSPPTAHDVLRGRTRALVLQGAVARQARLVAEQQRRFGVTSVVTSPEGKREYRFLTLPQNWMRVLLVSDRETQSSAAACCVRVGHFSDPDDMPGLAHFTEHMVRPPPCAPALPAPARARATPPPLHPPARPSQLFLGTDKYPDEAAYKRFLATHGGRPNASTATETTKFYFGQSPSPTYWPPTGTAGTS